MTDRESDHVIVFHSVPPKKTMWWSAHFPLEAERSCVKACHAVSSVRRLHRGRDPPCYRRMSPEHEPDGFSPKLQGSSVQNGLKQQANWAWKDVSALNSRLFADVMLIQQLPGHFFKLRLHVKFCLPALTCFPFLFVDGCHGCTIKETHLCV